MPHRHRKSHTVRNALIAIIALVVVVSGVVVAYQMSGGKPSGFKGGTILLMTSMGNITIELFDDMPITAGNFKTLTQQGIYDGTIFHRVVTGFVIQGGDAATSKGITVPAIQDELPNKHSNLRGSVAMAKTNQPNSATSQFFINLKNNAGTLDSNYSVFGQVTAGMDIADAIGNVKITPTDPSVPDDGKPVQDVTLQVAEIIG
jgi:peptidylprolyl isomerase